MRRLIQTLLAAGALTVGNSASPSIAIVGNLTINDGLGGNFAVGQQWALTLTGAPPNAAFTFCASSGMDRASCFANLGTTDATGSWRSNGHFDNSVMGGWTEWIQFASGALTNRIAFTVGVTSGSLTINGATGGNFAPGDPWTLALTGAPANTSFSICGSADSNLADCVANSGKTDANGAWQLTGQFDVIDSGGWTEWLRFPSGATSNRVSFTIGIFPVVVSIRPASATVQTSQPQQFTARVTGSTNQSVIWSVNGMIGGNATVGTISIGGIYTAPPVVRSPNIVTVSATSVAFPSASAYAPVTIAQHVIDFSGLPDQLATNLGTFLVSGTTKGSQVLVNGASASPESTGDFVLPVPLSPGANRIEMTTTSLQSGTRTVVVKTVNFDPTLSTAGRSLIYISSVAPSLPGTIVIDVDRNIVLGIIRYKRVRGMSPDGRRLYANDLSVISTATHRELAPPSSPLNFTQELPNNGFLVSPDGARLYARTEVLDLSTNRLLPAKLPVTIETGTGQGGPAISSDGRRIFCQRAIIDTVRNALLPGGVSPSAVFLSNIALTRDDKLLLLSSYAWAVGAADVYDATTFKFLGSHAIGDFGGEIVFSTDGTKALFGSYGNSYYGGGGLLVFDIPSLTFEERLAISLPGAARLAISDRDELFVSAVDAPGIDVFGLQINGALLPSRQFSLGINRRGDHVEKIVFKPPY